MKKLFLLLCMVTTILTAYAVGPEKKIRSVNVAKKSNWVTKTGTFQACGRTYRYWVRVNIEPNPSQDPPALQEYIRWNALRSKLMNDCTQTVVYNEGEDIDDSAEVPLTVQPEEPELPGGDPM